MAALTVLPQSALADQETAPVTTAEALETARQAYSRPSRRERCLRQNTGEEIVVCGDDDQDQRISPSSETDPASREALRDGLPRAPDLARKYPGRKVAGGCFLPPCPKQPVYMFDIEALPEVPEGSDAEGIAEGEESMP